MPTTLPKSKSFLRATDFILPHEEEFARGHWGDENYVVAEHDPKDPGGTTKYGIDARSHPGVDIEKLTRDQAIDIYWSEWLSHRLDLIPERLAIAAFDVYVNGGSPIKWLQSSYNWSHEGAKTLVEDGQLGPKTLSALSTCNQDVILRRFINLRNVRFQELARNSNLSQYLKGWEVRDSDLLRFLNVYTPGSSS